MTTLNEDVREFDLVKEVEKTMKTIGFKESSINAFLNSIEVRRSHGLNTAMQKANIIQFFNNLILLANIKTPTEARYSLLMAADPVDWLGDITVGFLPFIQSYENEYFK